MRDFEYDFIVIGGGTSGLVVASRLSEDPNIRVLVVEAGKDCRESIQVKIPGIWFNSIGGDMDWDFCSVEQSGLNGRKVGQPQGKALGGSSAINGQAFIAPSKAVFDVWESLGNPEWSWHSLYPYYNKFHTLHTPSKEIREHLGLGDMSENEAVAGPIQVSYATTAAEPLAPAWEKTFKNAGYQLSAQPFTGIATGGFSSPVTIDPRTKERSYSATAYWNIVGGRNNIHLITESTAEKIIFQGSEPEIIATGVVVLQNGKRTTYKPRRELILAAGVFQTPKLLEISGIGSDDILAANGITTLVSNSSVGENLQDHLMTGISFEVQDHIQTLDGLRRKEPTVTEKAMSDYETYRTGPLTLGGINYFSYMPLTPYTVEGSALNPLAHALEAFPEALKTVDNKGLALQYDFLRELHLKSSEGTGGIYLSPRGTTYALSAKASSYGISELPGKYITIGLSLLQPFSRGSSHIQSPDPHAKPRIDPAYLSNPLDVEVLTHHLRFIETLAATEPLVSLLKPGGRRNSPKAQGKNLSETREYVRESVLSNWHPVGTCSMMPRELGGVVDPRLKVYGTKNLRIVDASVMPIIPRGNIQSSVYTVAERAADLIKEDYAST